MTKKTGILEIPNVETTIFRGELWIFPKIGRKTPKMDGENHGNPYVLMDCLGGFPIIFGNTHIYEYILWATFLIGNPYKPSFATVTGRGPHPRAMLVLGSVHSFHLDSFHPTQTEKNDEKSQPPPQAQHIQCEIKTHLVGLSVLKNNGWTKTHNYWNGWKKWEEKCPG